MTKTKAKQYVDEVIRNAMESFPERGYLTLDWEDIPGIKYPFEYFEESGIEELISYIISTYGAIEVGFNYNYTNSFPCGIILCWGNRADKTAHALSILRACSHGKE